MIQSLFAGLSVDATPITLALLIVNVGASAFTLMAAPDLIGRFSMRPYAIVRGEWDRAITGSFLHGGFWHLAFNMWALLLFGTLLEAQIFGPIKFAILYFGSDLCASGLSIWRHRDDPNYSAVGASGAISGVILSYCLFAPLSQLYVFFIPMPADRFRRALHRRIDVHDAQRGRRAWRHRARSALGRGNRWYRSDTDFGA